MLDFRKIIGYYDVRYPALDPTTPHYEFNSYIECCKSLDVEPSLRRYFGYRNYLKSIGII
jgi:hypothetical protein